MSHARWTVPAQSDLARIDDFYLDLAPDFADRLGRAALASARFLADQPRAGELLEGEVRKWRVHGFDYVLLYRVAIDGVEILRMHHARENWRRADRP